MVAPASGSSDVGAPLPAQVLATQATLALIDALRAQHGPVLFHQSGGCCDGSSPMCFPVDGFLVGDRDVRTPSFHARGFYDAVKGKVPAKFELVPDMPHSMPPRMVEPLREVPGIRESTCQQPTLNACG